MQKLTDEQLKKLPKWAQHHLKVCYADNKALENRIRALFDNCPEDSTVVLPGFHGHNFKATDDQPVPNHTRLRFGKDSTRYIEVGLDYQTGRVDIRGSTSMSVFPESSNSISVELRERY